MNNNNYKRKVSIVLCILILGLMFLLCGCFSIDPPYYYYPGTLNLECYLDSEGEPEIHKFYLNSNGWYASLYVDPPQKFGYTFQGFYSSPEGGKRYLDANGNPDRDNFLGDFLTRTEDGRFTSATISLYAHWNSIKIDIRFHTDDDAVIKWSENDFAWKPGQGGIIGWNLDATSPLCPIAIKEGYDFVGWYTKDGAFQYSEGTTVLDYDGFNEELLTLALAAEKELHLYSKFEIAKATVTFDFQRDGLDAVKVKIIKGSSLSANDYPEFPHVEGYGIVAWSVSKDEYLAPSTQIDEDITLYAIWKKCKNITLNFMDGSAPIQAQIFEDNTLSQFEQPQMAGFEFVGWSRTRDGDELVELTYFNIANGETLYAVWISK